MKKPFFSDQRIMNELKWIEGWCSWPFYTPVSSLLANGVDGAMNSGLLSGLLFCLVEGKAFKFTKKMQ
jgi:hypothetical protein